MQWNKKRKKSLNDINKYSRGCRVGVISFSLPSKVSKAYAMLQHPKLNQARMRAPTIFRHWIVISYPGTVNSNYPFRWHEPRSIYGPCKCCSVTEARGPRPWPCSLVQLHRFAPRGDPLRPTSGILHACSLCTRPGAVSQSLNIQEAVRKFPQLIIMLQFLQQDSSSTLN